MTTMLTMLDHPEIREAVKRITVYEYHRLSEAAIIGEQTELLYGIILQQMTKSPLHSWTVRQLVEWLRANLPDAYDVRQEQPLTLDDSELESDVAIVRGSSLDYRSIHPTQAAVVMEVAIATLALDQEKASAYAGAGVEEYWMVMPQQERVDIYTRPAHGRYEHKHEYHKPATIALSQFPHVAIPLDRLFPDGNANH